MYLGLGKHSDGHLETKFCAQRKRPLILPRNCCLENVCLSSVRFPVLLRVINEWVHLHEVFMRKECVDTWVIHDMAVPTLRYRHKIGSKFLDPTTTFIFLQTSCLFNLYSEHITRNARLDELQARIKICGKNNSIRYAVAESEQELKSLMMRVKEKSERASLKLNIKKKKKN